MAWPEKPSFNLVAFLGIFRLFRKAGVSYKKGYVSDKETGELIKKQEENLLVKKKGLPLHRDGKKKRSFFLAILFYALTHSYLVPYI